MKPGALRKPAPISLTQNPTRRADPLEFVAREMCLAGRYGGSMGDDAVILEGVDSEEAKAALYSTVHGAGRLFGRKEAIRTFAKSQMDGWLQDRGVMLCGGRIDESPMAYRRLPEVLAYHAASTKVLHTLRPFAVAMAGEAKFDPWKD